MRLTKTKRWAIRSSVLAFALICGAFAACKAEGPPRPKCSDVVDGGAVDAAYIDAYTNVTTDAQPSTVYGMDPDPGPQCTDCTQAKDFEIMAVSDFEDGFAPAWFNYGEPGVLIEPPQAGEGLTDAGVVTNPSPPQPYWGLQVATLADVPGGERCGSKYALHMEGGRFVAWGGGYVTRHFITRGQYMTRVTPTGQHYCDFPRAATDPAKHGIGESPSFMPGGAAPEDATGCMFWASPVDTQASLLGVDVSDFDGISFWARRGPSGQSSLRVALVDDSTSEDLALFHERANSKAMISPVTRDSNCQRIKGCCRHCFVQLEHQEYVVGGRVEDHPDPFFRTVKDDRCWLDNERLPYFDTSFAVLAEGQVVAWDFRKSACGDVPRYPAADETPGPNACWSAEAPAIYDSWKTDHGLCCPRTMTEEQMDPYEKNGDPLWGGKDCKPYVFQFDYSSGNYCHTEGDILPEANQNRCGESFEASVVVDTEWKLFRIPWSEIRRFTPDKPKFNPKSVWQISFYFGQGYLDTYLDDVGFYRKRR